MLRMCGLTVLVLWACTPVPEPGKYKHGTLAERLDATAVVDGKLADADGAADVAVQDSDAVASDTLDVPPTADVADVQVADGNSDASLDAETATGAAVDATTDTAQLAVDPLCPKASPNAACGLGVCEPGQTPACCPVGCCGSCGDGKCVNYDCQEGDVTSKNYCPQDCTQPCGDGKCGPGETPVQCPKDCSETACGDGLCQPGESYKDCAKDCGTGCGNCVCEMGESFDSCPVDCGSCGDTFCSNCMIPGANGKSEIDLCAKDCPK